MDLFQRYGNLLRPDGTNQWQRTLPALESGYILPDERSLSDLLEYARKLAAQIRFYTLTGQSTGDWRPFLDALVDPSTDQIYEAKTLETILNSRSDWAPHLALFIVFLKLFHYLQTDLNELPQRHLRHYYEKELNLLRREAIADEVHVIFELARNAASTLIPAQSLLDAGKDSKGRPLYYATQSELVVSSAKVSEIRRLVGETDRRGRQQFFVSEAISELEGDSWYTFGRKQLDLDPSQRFMTEAQIGFAIASPILLMAEGIRELKIVATLSSTQTNLPATQGLNSALIVDLTGAEGWLLPDNFVASLVNKGSDQSLTLEMTLTLAETAPAVVAFDPKLHGEGPTASWPILRCRLNGASGYYETLNGLTMKSATLEVRVRGVKNLVVQNSQGLLTTDQAIPLFGTQPRLGSPFYIGSAEVFSKKLTSLTLHLEWQNLPEVSPEGDALFEHYRAYFDEDNLSLDDLATQFRRDFLVYLHILYNRSWYSLLPGLPSLFDSGNTRTISVPVSNSSAFETTLAKVNYSPQPQLSKIDAYKIDTKFGFIRLTLQGPTREDTGTAFEAFGHQMFPKRYATQAIALSQWEATTDNPEPPQLPNQPLTPTLASLSLDYSASVEMMPGAAHTEATFFRLEPFGYTAASEDVPARLVPEMGGDTTEENREVALGVLYLGLTGFTPPGNISLLFQIDQGTAGTAEILGQDATEWSYLSGTSWKILPITAVLNDSTYGFQEPGLVVLAVGKNASINHTTMPTGMVWLRALIRQAPESAARTVALKSQSVKATFSPTSGELASYNDHLQTGLEPETIKRLKQRSAAIKSVQQPYKSMGGRASETDRDFFRRCSERLRHRNRAVTPWDLERLVLEAFPEVFKVKCLPHSDADGRDKAGEAALVIVPNLRNFQSGNPLEPRASEVLLSRISDYINTDLAASSVKVHVIHPVYERILVDAQVAFVSGLDAGYYADLLNQELQRFLSPWAYEEGEDIVFGSRIYSSEILAFMEGRNYVDYIINFNLYHSHEGPKRGVIGDMTINLDFIIRPDPQPAISATEIGMIIGDTFVVGRGVEVAVATRSHAILVSHPEHRIIPINIGEDQCSGVKKLGIGYMTIGLDFNISI